MLPCGVKDLKIERMYENVKGSELMEGRPEVEAKHIAAATVNKHRWEGGKTKDKE